LSELQASIHSPGDRLIMHYGSLLNAAGRASMVAEVRRDEQTTALPTGSGSARRLR
jgi:hypothetical protein